MGGVQPRTPFGEAGHFSITFVGIFLKNQGLPNLPRSGFSLAAWSIRPLFSKNTSRRVVITYEVGIYKF